LNASHTGCRYYAGGASLSTAALGAFFDPNYEGDGLKIQEVIKRGPFAVKKNEVTAGCIIEKIDGEAIKAGSRKLYGSSTGVPRHHWLERNRDRPYRQRRW
jgi:tricorn protease